jgi:oxygen-independent coproporphyrinogen III oxidase
MCQGEIDMAALGERYAIDFHAYFADGLVAIEPLAADGLVEVGRRFIRATSRGRMLLRTIAMCFDAYLARPGATAGAATARYSKAI